jgi:hypothetical protein
MSGLKNSSSNTYVPETIMEKVQIHEGKFGNKQVSFSSRDSSFDH